MNCATRHLKLSRTVDDLRVLLWQHLGYFVFCRLIPNPCNYVFFIFFFVALTDTVDLDGCSLPTATVKVAVISLIQGVKKDQQSRLTGSEICSCFLCLSLTCIYSLMMSVKCSHECLKKKASDQRRWWWRWCKVWFVYQREHSSAVMMLLTEGLLTLTTRGRVTKQPHSRALWRRCFHFQLFF